MNWMGLTACRMSEVRCYWVYTEYTVMVVVIWFILNISVMGITEYVFVKKKRKKEKTLNCFC